MSHAKRFFFDPTLMLLILSMGLGLGVSGCGVDHSTVASEEVTLTPKGKVNWITPGDKKNDFFTGAGIQFKVITESNKQVINKFIARHQSSHPKEEKKQA